MLSAASPRATGGIVPIYNSHCIISAADPVTNGAAKEVPVTASYPPPARAVMIFTPGAASSGLIGCPNLANPRPEKSAYACVASSYAPTEIARLAVDGIVSASTCPAMPSKKRVSLFSATLPLAATDHTDHPVFLLESDGFSEPVT